MAAIVDQTISPSHQEAAESSSVPREQIQTEAFKERDHYDVMIVGMTGQGKSTTADKMVLASCQNQVTDQDRLNKDDDEVKSKLKKRMNVWLIGASPELLEDYWDRLVRSSLSENPHLDVNEHYEDLAEENVQPATTSSCQLVSNEATGIRVLDVPGFFGDTNLKPGNDLCTQQHIKVMRDILHIQTTMRLKFRRILYFLPVRGELKRSSGVLQHEVRLLARYFGTSVFEYMVLVATLPAFLKEQPFPEELLEKTRARFHNTLKEVLPEYVPEDTIPSPPAIFISVSDNCESIVEKVKGAVVAEDSLELSIHQGICLKCSSLINWVDTERIECIPAGMSEDFAIPFEESLCHPVFLPQGYTVKAVEYKDEVPYVTFSGKNKNESIEVCLNCGRVPGTAGCMRVRVPFTVTDKKGNSAVVEVDHGNDVENHRLLRQKKVDNGSSSELITPISTGRITPAPYGRTTPAAVDQITPVTLGRSTPAGAGRITPATFGQIIPAAEPQHRIIETTDCAQSDGPLSPKSSAMAIPKGDGERLGPGSDTTRTRGAPESFQEPLQDSLQVSSRGRGGSSFVAENSGEQYMSSRFVTGNFSEDMKKGFFDSVLRGQLEITRKERPLPEEADAKGT